jgi:methyl-accepting chemotaxis protein
VTIGADLLLMQLIHRPLKRLVQGTNAIGGGELNHRITLRGRDEFTDLAYHFNHMVDQLQTTLVSKNLVEASEEKLQATVLDLRREIARASCCQYAARGPRDRRLRRPRRIHHRAHPIADPRRAL